LTAIEGNAGVVANPREAVNQAEQEVLQRAFARVDPVALGVGFAAVAGLALSLGTIVLLVQGGQFVGFHLKALDHDILVTCGDPIKLLFGIVIVEVFVNPKERYEIRNGS